MAATMKTMPSKAHESEMKCTPVTFQLTMCGLFINEQYPFLHATPAFLTSCDCCGLGCREVKCPICIGEDCDFNKYVAEKSSCLEKINGQFQLQQQQLFTVRERDFCDFLVCGIDKEKNIHVVNECIYPVLKQWETVFHKLEIFWGISILPEIFGCWCTRKCFVPVCSPDVNGICFCCGQQDENVISCNDKECLYMEFYPS